ncbi:MAG: hypothetical protein ACON4O_06825 [Lentimonas sp.]
MERSRIQLIFAIILLISVSGCGKQANDDSASAPVETETSTAEMLAEEVKEDLEEIAAKAGTEAREIVESVKEASKETIENAKERLSEIKQDAAEEMAKVAEFAYQEIEEAGVVLEAVKEEAVQSLNNFLQPKTKAEEVPDQESSPK